MRGAARKGGPYREGEGDPPRMDFYRGSKADEMIVLGGPKQFLWARREG